MSKLYALRGSILTILFSIFAFTTAHAQITTNLTGNTSVTSGNTENYTWSFTGSANVVYLSGTLSVTGGIIVENNSTSIAVGTSKTVAIRWTNASGAGQVNVNYSFRVAPASAPPETVVQNKTLAVTIAPVTNVCAAPSNTPASQSGSSSFRPSTSYSFVANGSTADVYEWTVISGQGNVTISGATNARILTLTTAAYPFNGATLALRTKMNCSVWSASTTLTLTPDNSGVCAAPNSYPAEQNGLTALKYNAGYRFVPRGEVADSYQWRNTGFSGASETVGPNGTYYIIGTGNFSGGTVSMRSKKSCSDWSDWKVASFTLEAIPPPTAIGVKPFGPSDGLLQNTTYQCEGFGALYYEWRVSGSASLVSSNGAFFSIRTNAGTTPVRLEGRGSNGAGVWTAWASKDVAMKQPSCTAPTNLTLTTTLDGRIPCLGALGRATVNGPAASHYNWTIATGCLTTNGSNCYSSISSPGPSIDFRMGTSNFTNSLTTTITVTAVYCNGTKSTVLYRYIGADNNRCTRRMSNDESAETEDAEIVLEAVVLYPNPAQDLLNVNGCDNIRIVNSLGIIMKEITESTEVIDIKDLPKGLYILQAKRNGIPVNSGFQKE